MIREALELLTRPLRRKRWERRRQWIAHYHKPLDASYNPLADDDHVCFPGGPPEIPCTWEERDQDEVRQDVHRWVASVRKRFKKHVLIDPKTGRVALYDPETDIVDMGGMRARKAEVDAFLNRVKKDLKKKKFVGVEHPPGWVNPLANDEDGGLDMSFDPLAMDDGCCGPPIREGKLDMDYHSLSTDEE